MPGGRSQLVAGTRQDLVRRGNRLLPPRQHGLLDGEALLQRIDFPRPARPD